MQYRDLADNVEILHPAELPRILLVGPPHYDVVVQVPRETKAAGAARTATELRCGVAWDYTDGHLYVYDGPPWRDFEGSTLGLPLRLRPRPLTNMEVVQ